MKKGIWPNANLMHGFFLLKYYFYLGLNHQPPDSESTFLSTWPPVIQLQMLSYFSISLLFQPQAQLGQNVNCCKTGACSVVSKLDLASKAWLCVFIKNNFMKNWKNLNNQKRGTVNLLYLLMMIFIRMPRHGFKIQRKIMKNLGYQSWKLKQSKESSGHYRMTIFCPKIWRL